MQNPFGNTDDDEQPSLVESNPEMQYQRYVNQFMQDDDPQQPHTGNESFQDYMDDEESEGDGEEYEEAGEDFDDENVSGTNFDPTDVDRAIHV